MLDGRAMDTSKAAVCAVATLIGTLLLAKSDGPWARVLSFRVRQATAAKDTQDGCAPLPIVADAGQRRGR